MATKKILIVEDDKMLLEALTEIFVQEGYQVHGCVSAESAFKELKVIIPDLIITDMILQNTDGFEIIRLLKKNEETCNIPILVLSNNSDGGYIERAMTLGAKGFIIKADNSLGEILERVKQEL